MHAAARTLSLLVTCVAAAVATPPSSVHAQEPGTVVAADLRVRGLTYTVP
jgi:hypothetical protein